MVNDIMLLQATGITKRFGHRMVLNGIDLGVSAGEIVAIFGPNGAGKTTLIKILSTLVKPTSGGLQFGDIDAFGKVESVRPSVGLVLHEPLAYLDLSPSENLRFFGELYGVAGLAERIEQLLADVGLTAFANEPIKCFSRGMTQRFMIAKALIHDPMLLLFDEPFSGLDVAAKQFMVTLIGQQRERGKGIILTTHDIALGYLASSRFLFLFNGQIEAVGTKDEIEVEGLSDVYESRLKHCSVR